MAGAHVAFPAVPGRNASAVARALLDWWTRDPRAAVFGLAAGVAWGVMAAGSSVPRGYVVSDGGSEVAYLYGPSLTPIPAPLFLEQHADTVVKVVLVYLLFVGLAGWVTWQWVRDLRARGSMPRLAQGLDRYALALLVGGAVGAVFFSSARLEALFQAAYPTTADLIVGLVFVFLPAYGGIGLFLLWVRRTRLRRTVAR